MAELRNSSSVKKSGNSDECLPKITDELTPEVIYQARILIARQKFWTPEIEKLLRKWRRQINTRHTEHKIAERKYNKLFYIFGIPTALLTTVVASGVLTTFQNCSYNECYPGCTPMAEDPSCSRDVWVRLSIGIISVISLIFSGFTLFMNYGQSSSDNKGAADDYEELAREIDSVLDTPVSTRGDPIVSLQNFRSKFDDISKNAPTVSSRISSKASLDYRTVKEERKISIHPSPNFVVDGKRRKMPDASSLAKILVDKIEDDAQKQVSIRKRIVTENDFDSDVEKDKEVAIMFDLEELRPEDLLENEKKRTVQASLTRALEFELTRMYPPDVEISPNRELHKSPKRKKKSMEKNTQKGKEEDEQ